MPNFCAVVNCSSRGNRDDVRFFRIPAILNGRGERLDALSRERRECWVKSLKRGCLSDSFLKNARVCSRHFLTGCPAEIGDTENPDWVPTQNMGYTSIKTKSTQAVERHLRTAKRRKQLVFSPESGDMASAASSSQSVATPPTEVMEEDLEENTKYVETQTDLTMQDLTKMLDDMNFVNEKYYTLQDKLKMVDLSKESFVGNNEKTLYFTGFPKSEMLFRVFVEIENYLSSRTVLTQFQQFLLTLMKLRLNLPFKYLAYRFGISPATVSDMFFRCVDILYQRYSDFIFWPNKETLRKNMPACFQENFGDRITAIIDCFEILTETPSSLVTSAQCWSNYKHHQTVKFLIGITPQGTISYISDAWGGRTSDKFLTENCGFLDKILPNDIILADRGFLIRDSIEMLGAHLEIPAFTKGKNQLHPVDIETTRKIANVRIHVERVIGLLRKKYKICRGPIPISMLSTSRDELSALDKIVVICSCFVNMCPSVIPLS